MYKEIQFSLTGTLEDAVKDLLHYRVNGKLVYGEFNGVYLYSDTVTMDGAYKEVMGCTKEEFDNKQRELNDRIEKLQDEHKEDIPMLTVLWIERGRKILSKDKWDYWERVVPIRLNDLYQGMELGNCLDIVEILNDGGTLDEAREEIYNQSHSGISFSLVCTMVEEFCDRGKEFYKYVQGDNNA